MRVCLCGSGPEILSTIQDSPSSHNLGTLLAARSPRTMNKKIELELQKDWENAKSMVKILLLGAGESGKTTVLKQMRIIHDNGFSNDEHAHFRSLIRLNLLQSIGALVLAMDELGISYMSIEAQKCAHNIKCLLVDEYGTSATDVEICGAKDEIKLVWQDDGLKTCFDRASEFQLLDSAEYWLNNVDRICDHSYRPTDHDILRCRIRTSGIVEVVFHLRNKKFRERRKWIHCFDDVNSVLFVAAISEFDQTLRENNKTNRIIEALNLFATICRSRLFQNTSLILFLNKIDIFGEKIKKHSIKEAFPEFQGDPGSFDETTQYIEMTFLGQNRFPKRTIYPHQTCATDTEQVATILNVTLDIALGQSVKAAAL